MCTKYGLNVRKRNSTLKFVWDELESPIQAHFARQMISVSNPSEKCHFYLVGKKLEPGQGWARGSDSLKWPWNHLKNAKTRCLGCARRLKIWENMSHALKKFSWNF